jgi:fluoride ion exporter CrcB/FEX
MTIKHHLITILYISISLNLHAQKLFDSHFFERSDTLNKKRLNTMIVGGSVGFTGAIFLLNNLWYKDYPRAKFHFFDDRGEWNDADKAGHVLTAYTESNWAYQALRWTGLNDRKAALYGMGVGALYQATIEVLDGTSAEWGFSLGDFTANTTGCALFGLQQAFWKEQRIVLKVGNFPKKYDNTLIKQTDGSLLSISSMAKKLYGTNYTYTFFKDYNAINWWLSINPYSFAKQSKFPKWLNIAVGYSAENVFGAYYNLPPANTESYTRYRQYMLSLDIDLSKLNPKSKFLKSVCKTFNFIKIPAPALEYNSLGKFKFHPIIF